LGPGVLAIGVSLLSAALVGCPAARPGALGGGGGGGGGAGGELSAQCTGDFGANAQAQKLETLLSATATFLTTAAELEASLIDSCKQMGSELGIPDAEMEPTGNTPAARAACAPVAAKISEEMGDLRASASLEITVVSRPPRCEVSMDAYASCAAECDATVEPGEVDIQCEGGEIVGTCSAECTGSCGVEIEGECRGECEGTCNGGCRGTCQGACEGTCAQRGPDGQCNGRCDGTCRGSCSASCQGSCEGTCWVSGEASCSGECRGGCSVEYQEPRCTGEVRPPRVEAECQASCDARLNAEAHCEPGYTEVTIEGDIDSNIEERVTALRNAFRVGFGNIKMVAEKLRRLGESGRVMVETVGDIPSAVGSLGLQAASCASQAVAAIPRATASISVSVEVSASVSASAGAG